MKSINLNMMSVQVTSKTNSIRSTWTRELSEDLSMYGSINFKDELSLLLKIKLLKERCNNRKKSINKIFKLQKTS